MALAIALFLVTLIFVIWQPRGLQIGTTAVIGATLAVILGVVSLADVWTVTSIVWDATLAFIGIILLSMVLDEIGFFEWAALKMVRLSKGNGNLMFVYMMILGALVAAFFANDGAALILTPIILAKMKYLKMNPVAMFAFLMAGGFIGDSASNPLVISNLTNIVTAGYFQIGFWEYARTMFLPNLLSIIASIVVLWFFFRKDIPTHIDVDNLATPESAIKNMTMFRLSWWFLGLLMVGYFIGDTYHLPISVFALGGALVFLTIMIMDIAIAEAGNSALAYANIIGCNLGPKMTPIGSLATLLWLHVLAQKGVKIGWGEYMKVGLVITPLVLLVALLGLL
ncbi:MAG: anion permease [Epsilonproteobacteria bacterium]|nr:anion permease [Campylobacterota bacterium]